MKQQFSPKQFLCFTELLKSSPTPLSEPQQLTNLELLEEDTVVSVSQRLPFCDPYPDKTPVSMLSREFEIVSGSLTAGVTQFFNPAKLLGGIDTNQVYMKKFRYIRSGVKLRIVLLSNSMQYGMLMVSYLPHTPEDDPRWQSVTQQSQANAHMMDISEQNALELKLPFLNPALFWDLDSLDPFKYGWRVALHPLILDKITVAAPANVKFKVFASFEEPKLACYSSGNAIMQSGRNRPWLVRAQRNYGGLVATAGAIVSAASAWYSGQSLSNAVYDSGSNVVEAITGLPLSEPKSSAVKMDLCGDLTAPSGDARVATRLGDHAIHVNQLLPDMNNVTSIYHLIGIPTYLSTRILSDSVPTMVDCSPFCSASYASYLRPMFKYFRGSSIVTMKFVTSPMVSGRVQVTLYPKGALVAGTEDIGDFPTWIRTIRGSTDFTIEVPYLDAQPWQDPDSYQFPQLLVKLMDPLPQPFDAPPKIYLSTFVSGGDDFQLAGLQSFVSGEIATMQCSLLASRADRISLGSTFDFPYQGGVDLSDILSRYSSRDPDPQYLFPFPLEITAGNATSLDNFDYVANLFKFYTGPTNVRMLFSKGAADGLLRVGVGNSHQVVGGRKWKAGNSLSLTSQSVWPMVEFEYPYFNAFAFDSIWDPNGMFPQIVDETANISEFFLSATKDFSLRYAIPVPDFFLPTPGALRAQALAERPAIMQSAIPRRVGFSTIAGAYDIPVGTPTTGHSVLLDPNFEYGKTTSLSLRLNYGRSAGTTDFHGFFVLSTTSTVSRPSTATGFPGALAVLPVTWIDTTNSGKRMYSTGLDLTISNYGSTGPLYLNYTYPSTYAGATLYGLYVDYSIVYKPWDINAILTSPQTASDSVGFANVNSTMSQTLDVAVVNVPAVTVSNTPTVTVSGAVEVTQQPGEVFSVDGVVDIGTPVAVHGTPGSLTSVYVSNYPS